MGRILKEEWKDIAGYEGYYQVSNRGAVKSRTRSVPITSGSTRRVFERLFKPKEHKSGYLFVELSKYDKRRNFYIQRLVASAFISNPQCKPQVNHLDGNKHNNAFENLEWCTAKENIQHAIAIGLNVPSKRKISWAKCLQDSETGMRFRSLKRAANFYKRNYNTLKSQIKRGTCTLPVIKCTDRMPE